jgi:glyoxylase-like metal-dependent hydrolase (beta-lactamase superfamily II)
MKTTRITHDLFQLTRFPRLFPVNAYLVQEHDGFTLIDTAFPGSTSSIVAAAQQLGAPIVRIVLTHAHADHVGSLDALHGALPNAEVLMSEPGKLRGSWKTCATRPDRLIAGDAFQTRAGVAVSGTLVPLFPFPGMAT